MVKDCSENKIINPISGRCVNMNGLIGKLIKNLNTKSKLRTIKEVKEPKETKIKKVKEPKETKIKKLKEPTEVKVKKVKEPKEVKVKKVKEPKEVKVKKVKEPKETKVKKVKEPKKTKVKKVKEPTEVKVKKVKEPKETKVKKVKEPTEVKVKKVKEPKETKIKKVKEPKVKEPKETKVKKVKEPKEVKVKKVKEPKNSTINTQEIPKSINKTPLSELLKTTFKNYPLDHSFDMNQVELFIKEADPKVQNICRKIIKNTQHISFEKFIMNLNKIINELLLFIAKDRPIFILIDDNNWMLGENYKFKSNYWLFNYVSSYIKFKTNNNCDIKLISNTENNLLQNGDTIIFIDDCIYSGDQMSGTISRMQNYNKLKLTYYILVPFISDTGLKLINKMFNKSINRKYYCTLKIPLNYNNITNINDVLSIDELKLLKEYYIFFQDINNKYLIYFDHKLADTISTITLFYLGVVPNNYNKYIYSINQAKVIPIIKNCKSYITGLNILSPKCPSPPYKEGFKNFIKNLKANINNYKPYSIKENKTKLKLKQKTY
jgi:hypothetical protein